MNEEKVIKGLALVTASASAVATAMGTSNLLDDLESHIHVDDFYTYGKSKWKHVEEASKAVAKYNISIMSGVAGGIATYVSVGTVLKTVKDISGIF